MNSKEIADKYGKKHKHVLDAIRNLLKRNPELCEYFTKSFYYDKKHEKRPLYVFDEYVKQLWKINSNTMLEVLGLNIKC